MIYMHSSQCRTQQAWAPVINVQYVAYMFRLCIYYEYHLLPRGPWCTSLIHAVFRARASIPCLLKATSGRVRHIDCLDIPRYRTPTFFS